MFARTLVVLTLAAAVFASPAPASSTCKSGKAMCCNQVAPTGQEAAAGPLGALLGIALQGLHVPIGLQCNPISVLALASASNCNSQAVCCEDTTSNGLVGINCSPLNVQL